MYRIGVIGDRDSVLGFQALGLEVCPAENAEEARQALHRMAKENFAILYLTEQLAAQLQTRGCDITRSALAKMEVGQRHIYPDELKLLHELLEVSYEELFV